MSTHDPVRDFLREKGCAEVVVENGLSGLVESWESLVNAVEAGYALGLDDYLNELDARQLLAEALAVAAPAAGAKLAQRIQRADEQMQTLVEPTDVCLWGAEVADAEGWTAQDNWWYFSRPLQGEPEFLAEITAALDE
jgi:hypothetical protein